VAIPQIGETVLIGLTLVAMIAIIILSIIPFLPGPLLMWLVALGFAIVEGFDRLPLPPLILMTMVMVVGSTTEFWMPLVGMRSQGASIWGSLGTLFGGIAGTFFIPVPICGTLIGAIGGALLFEWIHFRDVHKALRVGASAVKVFAMSLVVELAASLIILAIFVASVFLTS
jgi:uncharacterized protein YqgC (DUF456 family)